MGLRIPDKTHAQLFRSRAPGQAEMSQDVAEQVGEGRFDKMVRLALSDPDDEVWRYIIEVAGERIVGERIREAVSSASFHNGHGARRIDAPPHF